MTERQALHLIEQFAAQAPFAIWITDSRGVTIFANKKLHDLLEIPAHPSGALGFNLFDDPSVKQLHLEGVAKKLLDGETIDTVVEVSDPSSVESRIDAQRKTPMTLRVTAYVLRSSLQRVEHYVIIIDDLTESRGQRKKMQEQLANIAIYSSSKEARIAKQQELEKEARELEESIRSAGGTPIA